MAKTGLDDFFASGKTLADVEHLIVDALPPSEADWGVPVPLDPATGPPFPVDVLPGMIGAFVDAVAEETQTAPDLAALVALGTMSAAVGGKYEVIYKPSNWHEPVHIMVTPVAEPGSRKSAVFNRVTRPLRIWEAERQERDRPRIAEWESKHRRLEKQLGAAESGKKTRGGEGISDGEAVRMAAVHELQEHLTQRPVLTEVSADDATPEAVKEKLIEQGGALAVMSAESAYLSNVAGRYSDAPHLDTILNGHAADGMKVSRKGKPTASTERACLTLCLMLQPEVVSDLGKIPGFRQRGGAARLLSAIPADRIGRRKTVTEPIPAEVIHAWDALVCRNLEVPRTDEPIELHLDPQAETACTRFLNELEPRITAEGRDMQRWLGKLGGTVLRLAGLLHLAACAEAETDPGARRITIDIVQTAITLGHYFHHHARVMYRLMYGRKGQSEAAAVLEKLREMEEPMVTRRDLHQRVRHWPDYQRPEDLMPALEILEEAGWVRLEVPPAGKQGGRPSVQIHLNPAIHAQYPQNLNGRGDRGGIEGFEGNMAGSGIAPDPGANGINRHPGEEPTGRDDTPEGWVEV